MSEDNLIPVRICCGQRHLGVQCPDGLVLCALCYSRVPTSQLNKTSDGQLENVCQTCAAEEQRILAERENPKTLP